MPAKPTPHYFINQRRFNSVARAVRRSVSMLDMADEIFLEVGGMNCKRLGEETADDFSFVGRPDQSVEKSLVIVAESIGIKAEQMQDRRL